MFVSPSTGAVLFVHTLPAGDAALASTTKLLDSAADALTVVAVAPDAVPASPLPTVPGGYAAAYTAVSCSGDALASLLGQVIPVLAPGAKLYYSLQVRGGAGAGVCRAS